MNCKKYLILLAYLIVIICPNLKGQLNRILYNDQPIFLNGVNGAWINFGRDIGPDTTDFEGFEKIFKTIHDSGGNCMRLWLHTNGVSTPCYDGLKVKGPGEDAISDLRKILDLAQKQDVGLILCLWSFDMLRKSNGKMVNARNIGILTVDSLMDTYIQNALIPMVDSLKSNKGIIAWEIFNEPEGMCPDITWGGWDNLEHVNISNVLRFINKCASAIHDVDSSLLVTNGNWALISSTNKLGYTNYYTDASLIAAGGKKNGTLDFYCLHHYDWSPNSPFEYPIAYWDWDKPVVLAEFFPNCKNCGEFSNYEKLYKLGYAGALGWSWNDAIIKDILREMKYMKDKYPEDVEIK